MFKRFGIAQALMGTPELILLDEPTAGLDPENAYHVREIIRGLKSRATVVVSSHNLAEIEDLCDHLAILRSGRSVVTGTTADLVGAGEILTLSFTRAVPGLAERLGGLPGVMKIVDEGEATRLQVRYDRQQTPPESMTREVLKVLVELDAPLTSLARGASLEQRFLEMTRE
jgi:ABC-type multidrug transport system ATPase subunit